ncbi:MAG: helix-hairpin-helix domain-containing protein [Deltaproteobacteria bacterium]|nr:helix-hairpin-helix domain-containing protein [Deltaproteobacteria bacterium]
MKRKSFKCILSVLVIMAMILAVTGPVLAASTGKININKAPVSELVKLNKVGEKYAIRIVDYRKKNGPFKKPEDIMNVKGIGIKIYEANKGVIVVK